MAEIKPVSPPGIWSSQQQPYGAWLFGGLGQPSPGFPGDLSPSTSQTNLPSVWNAWNPQGDQGMQFLMQYLQGAQQNPLNQSSLLQNAMLQGGQGGPGHSGMLSALSSGGASPDTTSPQQFLQQYGVANPSVGVLMDSLAQNGFASQAAGQPLYNMATGNPNGTAANFLLPFLMNGQQGGASIKAPPVAYQAPPIPGLNTQRQVP